MWTTEDGQRRSTYELEAVTVGHDLSRGVAAFKRGRINVNTTVVEDAETDKHVKGEPTEVATEENARSEALAASLGEELRPATVAEFPAVGFDGPVNAGRVTLDNLKDTVADEMAPDLARLIATAQEKLGTTTLDPDPADEAFGESFGTNDGAGSDVGAGTGDGGGAGGGDRAAALLEPAGPGRAAGEPSSPPERSAEVAEPARNRRSRSRVGASA